jgi:glycosyltransferase involved in cell wall biosynthesis
MKPELHIAVILPSTRLYGGVKRFIELGNRFVRHGHHVTLFTPEGTPPDWYKYHGDVRTIDSMGRDRPDVLFFSEPRFNDIVSQANATRKIFFHIKKSTDITSVLRIRGIQVFVNSSDMHSHDVCKYGIEPFNAAGGVDTRWFGTNIRDMRQPGTIHILTYGRLNRQRKGTHLVVKACERIFRKHPNIKLLLFDTPLKENARERIRRFSTRVPFEFIVDHPVEKNHELFNRADIFVSAEKNAGWANTAAEAMASHTPVIATLSGTSDFLFHKETGIRVWRHPFFIAGALNTLIENETLRDSLADNGLRTIQRFDWNYCADTILNHLYRTTTPANKKE